MNDTPMAPSAETPSDLAAPATSPSMLSIACRISTPEQDRPAESLSWPDADIILESSDGVEFHVHKRILAASSQFFAAMFALPQPGQPENASGPADIQLSEDSHTITVLLHAIYPDSYPAANINLDILGKTAQAAQKYDMPGVATFLSRFLEDPCHDADAPLRAFAIAMRHGWKDAARVAGQLAATEPVVGPYPEEFADISAAEFCRLLDYRRLCEALFDDIIHPALVDVDNTYNTYHGQTSSDGVVAALENLKVCSFCYHNSFVPLAGYRWQGPLWLIDHLHRTKEAYIQTTKPSSVMSPDLLVQTLSMLSSSGRNGGQCNECQKTVPINLICLQQRIEAALKVRMATMQLKLEGDIELADKL